MRVREYPRYYHAYEGTAILGNANCYNQYLSKFETSMPFDPEIPLLRIFPMNIVIKLHHYIDIHIIYI